MKLVLIVVWSIVRARRLRDIRKMNKRKQSHGLALAPSSGHSVCRRDQLIPRPFLLFSPSL